MLRRVFGLVSVALAGFIATACGGSDPEMNPSNQGGINTVGYHQVPGSGLTPDVATLSEQSLNNLVTSDMKLLYIATGPFKFYDYARVNTYKSGLIKIELFKYGQTIGSIRIKGNKMCVLSECSYSWPISKKFFGRVSYGDMFKDIIFRRPIFSGKGMQVGPNGVVIQRFQESGQILYYERNNTHSLFKNMTTGVVVAMDDYNPSGVESGFVNSLGIPQ